ncbi:MAG: thioredoxin [Gammaproteobacteria bacterium]|nr:thioredoxin [Gammaproteobacteria bacterium]
MSEAARTLAETPFDAEVLASPVPVLVDYWAEWCAPCRMIAPLIDQIAAAYQGRLKVVKVDVEEHPALARRYQVRSIPTLMLFRDGRPVGTHVGVVDAAKLAAFVEPQLA